MAFPSAPSKALQKLYDDPKTSDVTLDLGYGQTVRAHKYILCMASGWFREAFADFDINERTFAVPNTVRYTSLLLQYIYGFDPAQWGLCFDLWAVASAFDVAALRAWAIERCKEVIEEAVRKDPQQFVLFTVEVLDCYEEYGGELRRIVEDCCVENIENLMEVEEFREMVVHVEPQLAARIFGRLAEKIRRDAKAFEADLED